MEEKRASLQEVREEMLTTRNTLNNEKIQTEQGWRTFYLNDLDKSAKARFYGSRHVYFLST